jgi:hypothetical protein
MKITLMISRIVQSLFKKSDDYCQNNEKLSHSGKRGLAVFPLGESSKT